MRQYINLFLTLVMPISILFIAISTVYYSTDFIFSKAIRLGTISGVLIGISLSLLLAFILILIRILQNVEKKSVLSDSPIQKKKPQTEQEVIPKNKKSSYTDTIMLLINKNLAYELSINTINSKKIGVIVHRNKDEGSILLHTQDEEIYLLISPLTQHTSEIKISGTLDKKTMTNIISSLKEKEQSFIEY